MTNRLENPNDYGFTTETARREWDDRSQPPERMQSWRLKRTRGPKGEEVVTWVKDGEPMEYQDFMHQKSENRASSSVVESPETVPSHTETREAAAPNVGAVSMVEVALPELEVVRS